MNAQPTIQHIALDALRLSPRNARKTGGEDIDDLVASIEAEGILQNLVVTAANDGMFDVEAGGRRLRALQLLRAEGRLRADLEQVPCRVVDGDVAGEASLAENTIREAMHPADQFDAFKRMVDDGKSFEEVAARFGVEPVVVKRRLKLANVRPELFQLYRDGGMTLEQLQALALTDNHEMQRQAWFSAKGDWERHPRDLRRFITREEVSANSSLARFVGLDAYEAANGKVRRDLFGEDVWLVDRALLDKLAMDRLEERAAALRAQGWSWVEPHLDLDYATKHEHPVAMYDNEIEYTWASEADKARAEELELRIRQIEMGDADGDDDELDAEFQRINDEYEQLCEGRVAEWPADIKAQAGVLLHVDHGGRVEVEYARLKPGQKLDRKSGAITGQAKPEANTSKPKKPQLSADMMRRLDLHRAAACRKLLVDQPQLAVQLLTADLVAQVIDRAASTFDVRVVNVHRDTANVAAGQLPDLAKAPARSALDASIKAVIPAMKHAEILPWVQKLSAEQLEQVLAVVAAVSFENRRDRSLAAMADRLGCNMTDWWHPDAAHYLGNVPKVLILEAVTEACGKDVAATLEKLKKDALVAAAAKHLAGTGWLPKPLRGAGYALKGAGKGKPPAKKATAAAAKKKSAKKATAKKPAKKAEG